MNIRSIAVVATCALLAACGATAQLPTVTSTYAEGPGDVNTSASGTRYDVTKLVTRRIDNQPFGSYDSLQIEVTFAQPVSLPNPGGPPDITNDVILQVGIDTDRNTGTGTTLNCSAGSGGNGSWPGNNYYIHQTGLPGQVRLANGNFVVQDSSGNAVGEAAVAVSGSVLTMTVSLSTLGNDDGVADVHGWFGNAGGGATDCAPNPVGSVVTRK